MAAHQSRTTVSLLFSLFILSSVSSSPRSSGVFLPSDSDKVSLDFYYESLCPFCARFITKFLVKLFDSDLISIVDLHLSPWGNAKIRGNSTFDCQVLYSNFIFTFSISFFISGFGSFPDVDYFF